MAVVLSELLPACTSNSEKETRVKELLNKKYNKEFEVIEIYRQGISLPYFEAFAYDPEKPDLVFNVTVNTEDDGFSDTYVQKCVCEKVTESVSEHLDTFPGVFYVYTELPGMQPYAENPDIEIKDYWELNKENYFDISVFAVPEKDDAKEIYAALTDLLADIPYVDAGVSLTFVDETTMAEIQEYFETNDKIYMDFKQRYADKASVELEYKDGHIATDGQAFENEVRSAL